MLNNNIKKFMKSNNLNPSRYRLSENSYLFSRKELNNIVAKYGVFNPAKEAEISVADILGVDEYYLKYRDIFKNMSVFFDDEGDSHSRHRLSMLSYTSDEIVERLALSFRIEPIMVDFLGDNNYAINGNGFRRYLILRAHFLMETMGLDKSSEAYTKLKEKYTIRVNLRKADLIKTYLIYLLKTNPDFKGDIAAEYNDKYQYTGKVVLSLPDGSKQPLNDKELIDLARSIILNTEDVWFVYNLRYECQKESFKQVLETLFPELFEISRMEATEDIKIISV